MSFLAIETTGAAATVALMDDAGKTVTEIGDGRMDHLRGLVPMIRSAVSRSGGTLKDVRMIAVSVGPGSFTGIRIGVAAARTLAQVLSVPVVPVNTLLAMSFNDFAEIDGDDSAGGSGDILVIPMIDARRGQVYAAAYEKGRLSASIREDAYGAEVFLESVRAYAEEKALKQLIFCGDGAEANREKILSMDYGPGVNISVADGPAAVQNAEGVMQAALKMYGEGMAVSYEDVKAVYLRKAEAERKRETGRLGLKKKKVKQEPVMELPPEDGQVHYRLLDKNDADHLTTLDALCFDKAWSRTNFEGDLEGSRKSAYAGAFNSREELIGFAGIVFLLDEGDVNRVAVHPLYRAAGIGGQCLEMAMDQAVQQGVGRLLLEVREANRSAISLYKDHGFKVISKRKGYYAETGENALIMQKIFGGE